MWQEASRVNNRVGKAALAQIELRLALPEKNVSSSHLVQEVVWSGSPHAADVDDMLHTSRLCCINRCLAPFPVNILRKSSRRIFERRTHRGVASLAAHAAELLAEDSHELAPIRLRRGAAEHNQDVHALHCLACCIRLREIAHNHAGTCLLCDLLGRCFRPCSPKDIEISRPAHHLLQCQQATLATSAENEHLLRHADQQWHCQLAVCAEVYQAA
mmetsp:Transcript_72822/g.126339  ORF Transcript_72822/g.126339 Transcript_72822/m.126339 type:complete len:215 (+) Transcript_72822:345-989(+)